jgi:hypothetical protein
LGDDGWTPSHTATLSIKPGASVPAISTETWIFVCITSGQDSLCTTGGDGKMDIDLFGNDGQYQMLKKKAADGGGNVGGVQTGHNPSRTNDDSANPQFVETIVWGDAYVPGVVHQWSWVQRAAPIDGTGESGNDKALKQASLIFERLSTDTKKCVPIGWDPRGVVFDTKTLYPVKNVSVELYKKNEGTNVFEFVPNRLGLTNPNATSGVNGQYSFFVDPGWYKLKFTNPAIKIAKLTPQQLSTAKQLFADTKGVDHIYTEDAAIREELGVVEIANIPTTVTDESLLVKDLSIIDNVPPTADGDNLLLFGRVSHPRTKMIIEMNMLDEKGVIKKFVKTDFTDGLGEYNKTISQSVASEEPLVFESATLSFELNSFYTTGTLAQKKKQESAINLFFAKIWKSILSKWETVAATPTNTITIKPIPSYIEGIAYDSKGVPIANALIEVYPFYSVKPMYTTVADANGRYKIGSQHLPQVQYKLKYVKPTGEAITIDTSTFVKQNASLILAEKINPYEPKNTTQAEDLVVQKKVEERAALPAVNSPENRVSASQKSGVGTSTKPFSNSGSSDRNAGNPSSSTGGGGISSGMQGVVMVVVVLFVLLLLGVGAFIMMRSRQQQTTPQY